MQLHKMVNGIQVPLNEQEIAEFNQRTADHEAKMAELAKTEYLEKRKAEYPSESEMIEAMWDHVVNSDSTKMYACANKKAAVDIKHPKPEVK